MANHSNPFAVPFSTWWLDPRSSAPLARRLGSAVEYWLSHHEQKKLDQKQKKPLQYVTMVNRSHWLLLRESLVSLHRTWHSIPDLIVVSDGSWGRDEFFGAFHFWPDHIKVLLPEDVTGSLSKMGQVSLVELAKQHPLGLKLASIILLGREQHVFFVDSDILWFSDPHELMLKYEGLYGPSASVEKGCSYNEGLMRRFSPECLSTSGVNTGCVYLKGELCAPELLQELLIEALEQPRHNFNEQSIIAVAVQKNGHRFPPELCLVDFTDALTLKRRKPWREGFYARHYVNWMRHQFYRDAIALRRMAHLPLLAADKPNSLLH